MVKLLIVTAASLAMLGAAIAADLPRREPLPPPQPVPVGKAPIGKAPIGKAPIGKYPVGKYPVGQYPPPVVTKG
jgi:hypothetical protein